MHIHHLCLVDCLGRNSDTQATLTVVETDGVKAFNRARTKSAHQGILQEPIELHAIRIVHGNVPEDFPEP